MARITAFSYLPGNDKSFLHRFDPRFKIISLIFFTLSAFRTEMSGLFIFSLVLGITVFWTRAPILEAIGEMRFFFILLTFIFIARIFSVPGVPLIQWTSFGISINISRQGVYEGILVCWRLSTLMLTGFLLVTSTRPSQIKAAVQWFLIPFPFIPRHRLAVMFSLVIRFIPVILNQAAKTADAQKARGMEQRKNPVYRLIKFSTALMSRIFIDADHLVTAMEARCYSENRTDPELIFQKNDWTALFCVFCLCILMVALK